MTRVPVTDQPKCRARPAQTPPIIPLRLSLVTPVVILMPCSFDRLLSELNHFKVFLTRTAVRANPKFRYIFPAGPGRQPLFRATFFFFINPTTDDTHPDFVVVLRHVCNPVMTKTLVCHANPHIAPVSRPWLVQLRQDLIFPQTIATAMVFSPDRRPDAPVRRLPPGYWCNMRVKTRA